MSKVVSLILVIVLFFGSVINSFAGGPGTKGACQPKIVTYHVLLDTLQVAVGKTVQCAYSFFVFFVPLCSW